LAAAIGWSPTVIRFPTPAAENTLSYHFEIDAPPGVLIASASLIGGRPNVTAEQPSWDHVAGGFPVVGLHAIEVPAGSMSRCQVELRLNRRGWLTASLLTSMLSTVLLWASASLAVPVKSDQAPALAATLLTITAAVMVLIVKPTEHQMASRLVTSVRAVATISIFLLIAAGAIITFVHDPSVWLLRGSATLATICTLLVLLAWVRAQPKRESITSPWEQGLDIGLTERGLRFETLHAARTHFGFDKPAILVETSEGDHREKFRWSKEVEDYLDRSLASALEKRAAQ
jgi:hypothetical protein